jgi:hypothetical protein
MGRIMGINSGAAKRSKRKRLDAAAESQKGTVDRFIVKDSQVSSQNQSPHGNIDDDHDYNTAEVKAQVGDAHILLIMLFGRT